MDLKEVGVATQNNRHPWEIARFEVIYTLIEKYASQLMKNATILDVGCGDTFFVNRLANRTENNRFFAIDTAFDEEMLHSYGNQLVDTNIQVYNDISKIDLKAPDKTADGVLLLDVIEHVPNDITFLKELVANPLIKEETVFIISVPAFQSLFSSHDVFLGHYRRYNNRMLIDNIRQAGLQPLHTGYFFFSLLPIRIMQLVKEKLTKPKDPTLQGVGVWQANKNKDRLLKNILTIDFKIMLFLSRIGIRLPGLSNFIICKKLA